VAESGEEDGIVSGLLTFTVDGSERVVPELKWRANRVWQARMQEVFASLAGTPADTPEGISAMADAERGIVLAYDATGALGDLEDATEREIAAVYTRLVEVSFPQARSRTAVMLMLVRQAVSSAQASSPSSPSPTGASTPTPSPAASRSGRSGSSTGRRRSA
jgi:hypothetical protein